MNKLLLLLGAVAQAAEMTQEPQINTERAVCDGNGKVKLSFAFIDERPGNQRLTHIRCDASEGSREFSNGGLSVDSCDSANGCSTQTLTIDDYYTFNGGTGCQPDNGATDITKFDIDNGKIYASIEMLIENTSTSVTLESVSMEFSCKFQAQYEVTADEYGVQEQTSTVEFSEDFSVPESEFSMGLDQASYAASQMVTATLSVKNDGAFAELDRTAVSFISTKCEIKSTGANSFTLLDLTDNNENCGAPELSVSLSGSWAERTWEVKYMAFIIDGASSTYTIECTLNVCIQSQQNDGSPCDKALACAGLYT